MDDNPHDRHDKSMNTKNRSKIIIGDLLRSRAGKDLYLVISERITSCGNRELKLSGHLYYIWDRIVEKEFVLLNNKE